MKWNVRSLEILDSAAEHSESSFIGNFGLRMLDSGNLRFRKLKVPGLDSGNIEFRCAPKGSSILVAWCNLFTKR